TATAPPTATLAATATTTLTPTATATQGANPNAPTALFDPRPTGTAITDGPVDTTRLALGARIESASDLGLFGTDGFAVTDMLDDYPAGGSWSPRAPANTKIRLAGGRSFLIDRIVVTG